MQLLFRPYKGLISSLYVEYWRNHREGETAPHAKHLADLKQLRRELEGVRDTYRRVGNTRGQWLYALVEGNIVPFVKASATAPALFFAGVAFLAGFSERLAKDVFGNAATSLTEARQEVLPANDVAEQSSENVAKPPTD